MFRLETPRQREILHLVLKDPNSFEPLLASKGFSPDSETFHTSSNIIIS